jgi:hypothetical protein
MIEVGRQRRLAMHRNRACGTTHGARLRLRSDERRAKRGAEDEPNRRTNHGRLLTPAAGGFTAEVASPRDSPGEGGFAQSAADVFTFDFPKQKGRPQQRDAFGQVKRAEALDLMTVRFDLSGLDSEMPLTLAMMPVLPKHGTDVEHFDNPTLKPPVGTGPYIIADVQPGSA